MNQGPGVGSLVLKKWTTLLISFQQSKTPALRSKCPYCFKMVQNIEKHVENHVMGRMKTASCPTCGKSFGSEKLMQTHRMIHTGERPFACGMCDYRSTQKGNLKTHIMKKHTLEGEPLKAENNTSRMAGE